jgi:SNF2 family DNA or RNA helicase
VQNNMGEMFCLLHYLSPKIFDENAVFEGCFSLVASNIVVDRKALTNAHYMLRTFVLRRLKTEVEFSLPSKLETLVRCPLSAMQTFWTKALLSKDSDLISRIASDDKGMAESE